MSDIFPDHCFISSHCWNMIPSCPEILSRKILSSSKICSCNWYGTFPFEKSNNLRHWVFCWYLKQHMYIVTHQMSFFNCTLFLYCQISQHLSQVLPQLFIDLFLSIFWYPYNMIFAFPFCMTWFLLYTFRVDIPFSLNFERFKDRISYCLPEFSNCGSPPA